ncbi:MAG: methyltransferase domain-containing protein [Parvularculaceae bacterium]|jgi:SAM-dependent methyltransferase|nr:methyltransferase domain-containing protein [Parvularculaceae bacterium]
MRTDIVDLHAFYERPLGCAVRDFLTAHLVERWGAAKGLRVAGFGYAAPFLGKFDAAERVLALAPAGQGAMRWPLEGANREALVEEERWPLADASIDRLLIVHGLEETGDPRRLMREAWRVLANDGRLIIIVAHRRGLWSIVETTPFAHGRPYLRRQLFNLLGESMFRPIEWAGALYFPPANSRALLRAASAWERAGARLWPFLGGVLMIEAAKEMLAPVGRAHAAAVRALRPQYARPAGAMRDANPLRP